MSFLNLPDYFFPFLTGFDDSNWFCIDTQIGALEMHEYGSGRNRETKYRRKTPETEFVPDKFSHVTYHVISKLNLLCLV